MKQCSKSENVLIIDSDYEEADGFIKGVREVTGEEWQVALHENNKIYGWRRYVRFFVLLNAIYVFLFFMDFNKNNRLQKQSEITLKDRFCKCIEVISKNTMGIYLVHVLVLRTIEKFSIQASFTSNITVGIIYSIVVTLISLIITLCVKRIPVVGKFI